MLFVVNIHKRAHQCDLVLIALYTDCFSSTRNLTVECPRSTSTSTKNSVNNSLNFRHCNAPSSHRNEDWSAPFCVPLGALKRRQSPLVSFSELGGHASSFVYRNVNSKMAQKSINIGRNQPYLSATQ